MNESAAKKNIIVAGAGFGGIASALLLNKAFERDPILKERYRLLVINNRRTHLYIPALYEIAAVPMGYRSLEYVKSSVAVPLADIFAGTNVEWREAEITGINPEKREVILSSNETCEYTALILALGSETCYFNIPGAKERGLPLKTFKDAIIIRDKVQALAETPGSHEIVVAGAGASGVETAAEFMNFARLFDKAKSSLKVTLLEGGPAILPGFEERTVKKAEARLAEIGVAVKTRALITEVKEHYAVLKDGSLVPYTILVWTGGVTASPVLKTMGIPLSPKGSIPVSEFLEAAPGIFAIGDNAAFRHPETGKPLPWNASVAEDQAVTAAENVIRQIKFKELAPFRPKRKYPFVLAAGNKYAIADLGAFSFSGISAWALKQIIELRYFLLILPYYKAVPAWLRYVSISASNDTGWRNFRQRTIQPSPRSAESHS